MKVLLNKQIADDSWNDLLRASEYASPFQTPAFFDLFNSIPGYSALAVAVEDSGILLALAVITIQQEKGIKGYFSRRAILYGGPIIVDHNTVAIEVLLNEINSLLKGRVIYTETRNLFDYGKFSNIFKEYGWSYQPYLNFHLNCSTREIAWEQLNNNRKRQINKALKNGVLIKEADSLSEIKEFYAILKDLYITKIKKPLFDFEFFEVLYQKNIGKFLLVQFKERIIGGIMCPFLPEKAIYEFYICGLDLEFKEASPSVMATYAAIEYGYKNGLQYFDFMGAGKPDENYGVREFKEKFGGELVEHGRYIRINNPFLYKLGKNALSMFKRIK